MISNDMVKNRDEIRGKMQQALRDGDTDGFYQAFDEMIEFIGENVHQQYGEKLLEFKQSVDSRILAQRGVRQLTNKEHEYYQKLTEAMKSANPKQALIDTDLILPKLLWMQYLMNCKHLIRYFPKFSLFQQQD